MLGLLLGAVGAALTVQAVSGRRSSRGLRGAPPPPPTSYYDDSPQAVRDLPFNMLRTHLPLESQARMQSIEQYLDGEPEVIAALPQNFAFSRWKQGSPAFGASAQGLIDAVTARDPQLAELVNVQSARVPHMTLRSVGLSLNTLSTGDTGSRFEDPVSRGIPQQPLIPADQFWAYAESGGRTPITPMSPFEQGLEYDVFWDGARMLQIERR